jgi:exodeoxyribonuclease VII large subunit
VFDDSVLARAVASVPIPFFSAIGHAENMTLVERLADKCFETPTTFGNHLRMLLENTAEELKQSKTAMLEQVRKEYQEEFQKEREQTNKAYNESLARIEKEREQRFKEYE